MFLEVAEGNRFAGAGGNRYSYIYSGDVNGDGQGGNDLIYIPRDASDIILVPCVISCVTNSVAEQSAALEAFISQDAYLSSHRGQISQRFGAVNPWYNTLDLRLLQDFSVGGGQKHTMQLSFDLMNVGNLVKANDTPFLVQLNQVTPIYATFSIPENQLDAVRKFAAGNLKVLAFPKGQNTNPAEGKLTFIDNGVDMQTGTVKLKATFANKDRRLWPGQYVDVVLNLSTRKQAVLVPTKAIQTGQQGQYVYVVTPQSTAESRNVETSGTYQNSTVIAGIVVPACSMPRQWRCGGEGRPSTERVQSSSGYPYFS